MRILIRTSRWATWARRLGSLAVPVVVIPVLMHREGLLDARAFFGTALFALVLALLAVLSALIAIARLWQTGDQGWGRALLGLFLGTLCLLPFGWYGYLAWRYPPINDIATAPRAELPLIFDADTRQLAPPALLTPAEQQRIFPNAETRAYPLDEVQLFAIVERMVGAEGWDVRLRIEPDDRGGAGRINARIVTLPGWREEVVLRVEPSGTGGVVDMRSASIGAPVDFGSNGLRVSAFMVALDDEVTAFLRDNPTINAATPAEPEPSADVPAGADN